MTRKNFVLTAIAIFFIEWWLWPIFHWQLNINLLAIWILAVAFIDGRWREKLGLIILTLFLLEFKSGQSWGVVTLALLLTLLLIAMASRVMMLSSPTTMAGVLWLLVWYHLFAAISRGLDWLFFWWEGTDPLFRSPSQLNLFSWSAFWEIAVAVVILTIYLKSICSRTIHYHGARI